MSVQIMIQFDGRELTIPINPAEIEITSESDNEDIDIIGLGPATRKGAAGLKKATIESFFPAGGSYFYTGVLPRTCVEFIQTIHKTENVNNKVARIVTSGLPVNLNMYFVIDEFNYNHKAGEEDDIYYTLSIKEYIPYGAKTVSTSLSGLAAARAVSPVSPPPPATGGTYTVVRGDCLWKIAKRYTGNGNNWPELYALNTDVIGANPNLIYPGQELELPVGW